MSLFVKERFGTTVHGGGVFTEREPSVAEVVVWLREQGAGFTGETWEIDDPGGWFIPVEDSGLYLVIPLDTEPPKESE